METKILQIGKIIPNKNNAKIHPQSQVDKVIASIEEFGYNTLIVVDETSTVLVGHCRLEALKQMGEKKIKVAVIKHLSDTQKRAYMLADNRLSEDAEWDAEMLQKELLAIQEDASVNFESMGFTAEEIAQIEEELALNAEEYDDEDLGEVFDPNTSPTASNKEVTQADMDKSKTGLDGKYKDGEPTEVEVVCPHCKKSFEVVL